MKKLIISIIIILAISTAAYFFLNKDESNDSESQEFTKVIKGDLTISIRESGFLNAVKEIEVKNECTIKQLNVIEVVANGTWVEEGEFLIELDSAPLEEEKLQREGNMLLDQVSVEEAEITLEITKSEVASLVSDAESKIDFAKIDLDKFEKLEKARKLDDSLAEIAAAKDQLKLAEQTHKTSVELAGKGFETKSKVDRDKLDLAAKGKLLKSAEAKYKALKEYDLRKEELQLKRDLGEAISKLERERKQGQNKIQRAEAKLNGAKAKLKSAEESLQIVKKEILKTKIVSTVSGYALYPKVRQGRGEQALRKGGTVFRNQTLLRIPNMESMKIDVKVAEHFVTDVKVGQKVSVTIDSLKGQEFSGKVAAVSLLPVEQNFWERAGSQKYRVTINLNNDELPDDIKPQISASAEIFIEELTDTTYVPVQAVHTVKGKQVVFIQSNSEKGYDEKEVKIGKMNTNFIQILDGVSAGEEVLISEP